MFIPSQTIQKLKQIPITEYLSSIGIEPVEIGSQLVYRSPLTNEKTPSFCVHPKKNLFNDFSSGKGGSIIDLIMALEKCNFSNAAQKLLDNEPLSFSFSRIERISKDPMKIKSIVELENANLIAYANSRAISTGIAKRYLQEVHYCNNGRDYYAVGFKNDAGGYELRSSTGFKSKTANGISTIYKGTQTVALFEGFFDFLSALQYYKVDSPNITTVILNTTHNFRLALPFLEGRKINCFLDNDEAGVSTVDRLNQANFSIANHSISLYPDFNDFNEFLQSQRPLQNL